MDRSRRACRLHGVRITNAVKCLPPENKPLPAEIKTCNQYLAAELAKLHSVKTVLALGTVAHEAVLMACGLKRSAAKFGHGNEHELPGRAPAGRFLPLQPLQHADAPADGRDVPDRAEDGPRRSRVYDSRRERARRQHSIPKDFIPNLPRRPGVYRMYSAPDEQARPSCCTSARRAACATASATTSSRATSIRRCRRWSGTSRASKSR